MGSYDKSMILPHSWRLLQALAIAAALSFSAPAAFLSAGTLSLEVGTLLPGLNRAIEPASQAWFSVLKVFGSGQAWQGIVTIALACALVGSLFEVFVFYQYQINQIGRATVPDHRSSLHSNLRKGAD